MDLGYAEISRAVAAAGLPVESVSAVMALDPAMESSSTVRLHHASGATPVVEVGWDGDHDGRFGEIEWYDRSLRRSELAEHRVWRRELAEATETETLVLDAESDASRYARVLGDAVEAIAGAYDIRRDAMATGPAISIMERCYASCAATRSDSPIEASA